MQLSQGDEAQEVGTFRENRPRIVLVPDTEESQEFAGHALVISPSDGSPTQKTSSDRHVTDPSDESGSASQEIHIR